MIDGLGSFCLLFSSDVLKIYFRGLLWNKISVYVSTSKLHFCESRI